MNVKNKIVGIVTFSYLFLSFSVHAQVTSDYLNSEFLYIAELDSAVWGFPIIVSGNIVSGAAIKEADVEDCRIFRAKFYRKDGKKYVTRGFKGERLASENINDYIISVRQENKRDIRSSSDGICGIVYKLKIDETLKGEVKQEEIYFYSPGHFKIGTKYIMFLHTTNINLPNSISPSFQYYTSLPVDRGGMMASYVLEFFINTDVFVNANILEDGKWIVTASGEMRLGDLKYELQNYTTSVGLKSTDSDVLYSFRKYKWTDVRERIISVLDSIDKKEPELE